MNTSNIFKDNKDKLDKGQVIEQDVVTEILLRLKDLLNQEENIILLQSPITICGDIHGQYEDVIQLFETAGAYGTEGFDDKKFLFMGDYVDRGYYSMNTFLLLATLKLAYPSNYFLLRGNHETRQVTTQYGFYNEILLNYGTASIWSLVNEVFDLLPLCALVDNSIYAVHGGLSPRLPLISLVQNENRQVELPQKGPIADLLWSDPDENTRDWRMSARGAGYMFGATNVRKFNHLNKIDMITRSHQLANNGFIYHFKSGNKYRSSESKFDLDGKTNIVARSDEPESPLLLVWSAPNYSYRSGNTATILQYNYPGQNKFVLLEFNQNKERISVEKFEYKSPYFT